MLKGLFQFISGNLIDTLITHTLVLISKIVALKKDRKIQMSISSELPVKCQECAKSAERSIYTKCSFCREIDFSEAIFAI